jgi:hypothetical protein
LLPEAVAQILQKELAREADFGVKLETWLAQRRKR